MNDPPVAAPDFAEAHSQPVLIPVLANDSDPDGDSLAITAVTQGASGFVSHTGTTLTYSPDRLRPTDQFTHTVSDGFGGTATASVTVTAIVPAQAESLEGSKDGTVRQPFTHELHWMRPDGESQRRVVRLQPF